MISPISNLSYSLQYHVCMFFHLQIHISKMTFCAECLTVSGSCRLILPYEMSPSADQLTSLPHWYMFFHIFMSKRFFLEKIGTFVFAIKQLQIS